MSTTLGATVTPAIYGGLLCCQSSSNVNLGRRPDVPDVATLGARDAAVDGGRWRRAEPWPLRAREASQVDTSLVNRAGRFSLHHATPSPAIFAGEIARWRCIKPQPWRLPVHASSCGLLCARASLPTHAPMRASRSPHAPSRRPAQHVTSRTSTAKSRSGPGSTRRSTRPRSSGSPSR